MKRTLIITFALLGLGSSLCPTSAQTVNAQPNNLSLQLEVKRAIDRGTAYLVKTQDDGGWWSDEAYPAVTSLATRSLLAKPGKPSPTEKIAIDKGLSYIRASAKRDGGIYRTGGLQNYNTAVSLTTLAFLADPQDDKIILKARNFIAQGQQDYGESGDADTPLDGGIGYGNSYTHSDMSNTLLALESLYHSEYITKDQPAVNVKRLNWEAAISFLQSCQNLPSHNKEPWASADEANKGGFVYFPGDSKAGEMKLPSGRVALRSYGSISYAGLLSFIYADLSKDDERVVAVKTWLAQNYTLEENPGMGPQGLFYYYHTMAKALTMAQIDRLGTADGKQHNWREELSKKLINLQREDGRWENDNGRWWEKEAALTSAYVLLALETLYPKL